jgi:alanine racemase
MKDTPYIISNIAMLLNAKSILPAPNLVVSKLLIDSRAIIDPSSSLFFAVIAQRDGHNFIQHAYQSGVRNFVISQPKFAENYNDANFLIVDSVENALQKLAAHHRSLFDLPVIGITGSNGKTIVKEWLHQLLNSDFSIVRSPKSFNSQIGVPLSIWQMSSDHNLGIFEAGISKLGEMQSLANIIKPTIGILTNIGEAHAEGFSSKQEKLIEKLKLFDGAEWLIYSPDYVEEKEVSTISVANKFTWSRYQNADLQILNSQVIDGKTQVEALYKAQKISCIIPFVDQASVENGMICWATLLALAYDPEVVANRIVKLSAVSMRLELINGINQCSIIDDSYSADISSLAIALDFLNLQNQHSQRTVILSDIFESGKDNSILYTEVSALLAQKKINRLIGIGPNISAFSQLFDLEKSFYDTTQSFISHLPEIKFANETILIKGARKFEFERISRLLTYQTHATTLEINLNAIASNLQHYRSALNPGVKIMAMVKAFSYGSGSFEIANLLQYKKVDYLAVAYADEGIALRNAGIDLPIMVMSPEPSVFEAMVKYKLEPEIYSVPILNSFLNFLPASVQDFPVHIKFDTGMHRLGFEAEDLTVLKATLKNNTQIYVNTIFTHLVGSDHAEHDEFTTRQINQFNQYFDELTACLGYRPLAHVLNTSGVSRWPNAQFDMVRIGIGLYGFDSSLLAKKVLQPVAVLKTTVTQVKNISAGETVGYNRKGVMPNGGKIATVKIGYADGYNRKFGNGVGKMLINGKSVPTIGSICMDMCMLDVTGLSVKAGDEVIVFNEVLTIADLAKLIDTIPYEILTNISQRVKRLYYYE